MSEARLAGESESTSEPDTSAPDDGIETRRRGSFLKELPVLIVIAFAVALLIKTFLLQAFFIPSASMEPTLREGDRVLVEKVSYAFGGPEQGDVVVFERDAGAVLPMEAELSWSEKIVAAFRELFGFPSSTTQDFIKRVMAVEGDVVEGRDGRVVVNGTPVEEPWLDEGQLTDDFGPITVPADHVFMMGDNRDNSDDSRGFGPVPEDRIVGHAFVLIWPPRDVSTL